MLEAAPLAEPQKRAILEPDRVAVLVHPRLGRFAKQRSNASGFGVSQIQVEPRLLAVLNLIDDVPGIWCPVHVDDEEVRVRGEIDPGGCAAAHFRDPELDRGIGVPSFRVVGHLERRSIRNVVDDRVLRDRPLVELQKRHTRGIRTPPVPAIAITAVNLLLIEPVEFSIEDLAFPVIRERPLLLRRNVDGVEIVRTHKCHELPVRTEGRFLFDPGRRGET